MLTIMFSGSCELHQNVSKNIHLLTHIINVYKYSHNKWKDCENKPVTTAPAVTTTSTSVTTRTW
jgi:hypothetical protein